MSASTDHAVDMTRERSVRTVMDTRYRVINIPEWVKKSRLDRTLHEDVRIDLQKYSEVQIVDYRYGSQGTLKRYPKRKTEELERTFVVIPAGSVVQYLQSDCRTICFIANVRDADGREMQVAFDRIRGVVTVRLTAYSYGGFN